MNQKQYGKIVPIVNETGENFTGTSTLSMDELDIIALVDGEKDIGSIAESQNLTVEMFLQQFRRLIVDSYLIVREPELKYELMTFYDEFDKQNTVAEELEKERTKPAPKKQPVADFDEKRVSRFVPEINASGIGTPSSFQFSPEEQTVLLYINGESSLSEIARRCSLPLFHLVQTLGRLVLENFVFFERPTNQKEFKKIARGEAKDIISPEPSAAEVELGEFDKDLIGSIIPAINVSGQGIDGDIEFSSEEQTILLYIGSNQSIGEIAKITGISLAGLVRNLKRLVRGNFVVVENENHRNALKEIYGDWDDSNISSLSGDEKTELPDEAPTEFDDGQMDEDALFNDDYPDEELPLADDLSGQEDFTPAFSEENEQAISETEQAELLEDLPEDVIDDEPEIETKPIEKIPVSEAVRIKRGKWNIDSFVVLINEIYEQKITGRLRISNELQEAKNLFFDKGDLINVFGKPFLPENCLGQLLMRVGKIEKEDVVDSLVGSRENKVLQGEQLVKMDKISADDLLEVLNFQVETKLDPIFSWKSGTYELLLIPKMSKKVRRIDVNLPRLLFNLMWRNADDKKIGALLRKKRHEWIGKEEKPLYDLEDMNFRKKFLQFWDLSLEKDIVLKRLFVISNLNKQLSERLVSILLKLRFLTYLEDTREDLSMTRIKELSSRLLYIENEDKFSLLGIHWSANDGQVKVGYEKVRQKHLKQIEKASPEEARLIKELLKVIKGAYNKLKEREHRQEYRQEKYDETYIEINSETFRQKGESFLFTKDDYAQSIIELENAIEIWEFGTEILVVLGLSKFLLGYGKNKPLEKEGRKLLQKGYDSNAEKEISNLCMGMMCKKERRNKQAVAYYEKALKANPKCRFAMFEIKEITTGKEDKEKKKAIKEFLDKRNKSDEKFDRIMKRKKEMSQ